MGCVDFCFLVNLFIYFERDGERERIPSRLRAVRSEPDAGLGLTNREIVT